MITAAFGGLVLAGACGARQKTVTYEIRFDRPIDGQPLFLSKVTRTGQLQTVDTIRETPYTYPRRTPDLYFIGHDEEKIPVILGNSSVTIHIDSAEFDKSYAYGSRENDSLYGILKQLDSLDDEQKKLFIYMRSTDAESKARAQKQFFVIDSLKLEYQYRFAERNPNIAGVVVMTGLTFAKNKEIDYKRLTDIYATYPESVRKSEAGKYLTYRLNKTSAGQVGFKAPNFTAPTPDGQTLSLLSSLGKVTIIDFWASWCIPCRKDNPELVALYKKYHDQGLNIIGVSLDHDKEAWINAIRSDSLNWFQVSHLQGWKEPIAQQYNIHFIPQLLILDRTGTIRAKNLKGKELEDKIRELLNE